MHYVLVAPAIDIAASVEMDLLHWCWWVLQHPSNAPEILTLYFRALPPSPFIAASSGGSGVEYLPSISGVANDPSSSLGLSISFLLFLPTYVEILGKGKRRSSQSVCMVVFLEFKTRSLPFLLSTFLANLLPSVGSLVFSESLFVGFGHTASFVRTSFPEL